MNSDHHHQRHADRLKGEMLACLGALARRDSTGVDLRKAIDEMTGTTTRSLLEAAVLALCAAHVDKTRLLDENERLRGEIAERDMRIMSLCDRVDDLATEYNRLDSRLNDPEEVKRQWRLAKADQEASE